MDNIIASTLLPGVAVSTPEKPLTAMPEVLPAELKPGDMILLQTILETNTFKSGDLFKLNWQPEQSQPQEISVRLNTPFRLEAKVGELQQFAAKVQNDGSLHLQPLRPTSAAPAQSATAAAVNSPVARELPSVTFQPLKTAPLLNNLMTEMDFPPQLKSMVAQALPPTEFAVILKSLNQPLPSEPKVLAPLQDTLCQMLPAANNPLQLEPLLQKLGQEIKALHGQVFEAQTSPAQIPGEINTVFDSPLGRIFSEQPLKLPADVTLQLELKSPETSKIFEDFPLLRNVAESLARILPAEGFVRIEPQALVQALRNQDDGVVQLLKIFEPLQQTAPRLAAQVLAKLPGLKADVLPNIYKYYQAAEKGDIHKWLGAELTAKISAEVPRGAETVARLESMVSSAVRETPLWRTIEIPFFDGSQFLPMQIALFKDPDEEKNPSKTSSRGTRFMINTEFSKLGAFQLDGYAVAAERRFDLVIRTDRNHANDFCTHIINLFKKSLYDVAYSGTIKINQREAFVKTTAIAKPREGLYV